MHMSFYSIQPFKYSFLAGSISHNSACGFGMNLEHGGVNIQTPANE